MVVAVKERLKSEKHKNINSATTTTQNAEVEISEEKRRTTRENNKELLRTIEGEEPCFGSHACLSLTF